MKKVLGIIVILFLVGFLVISNKVKPALADLTGSAVDSTANKADLFQITNSTGTTSSQINWESMVRSTVGAVNWTAIVFSNNSVNWNQVILPTAP